MNKASEKRELAEQAREYLTGEYLVPGQTVYAVVRRVSASGMSRHISFHVIHDGRIYSITHHIGHVLGYRLDRDTRGLVVRGAGMDMAFHVVYSLGHNLFGDGYSLKSQVI